MIDDEIIETQITLEKRLIEADLSFFVELYEMDDNFEEVKLNMQAL